MQAYGTVSTQSGCTFSVLRAPVPQKMTGFLEEAISLDLVFTFECYADDGTPAGQQLNNAVCSHLARYSLRFSQALPLGGGSMVLPRSFTRTIPSASLTPLLDVHTLPNLSGDDYEWNFLASRKGQRKEAVGAQLTSSSKPPKEITFSELDKIGSRVPRPPAPYQEYVVLFIRMYYLVTVTHQCSCYSLRQSPLAVTSLWGPYKAMVTIIYASQCTCGTALCRQVWMKCERLSSAVMNVSRAVYGMFIYFLAQLTDVTS